MGSYDAIHVCQVSTKDKICKFTLTSTLMLQMMSVGQSLDVMNMSGSITRQTTYEEPSSTQYSIQDHVKRIGRLVEDMENSCRFHLQEIYFGKTKDVFLKEKRELPQEEKPVQ